MSELEDLIDHWQRRLDDLMRDSTTSAAERHYTRQALVYLRELQAFQADAASCSIRGGT